MGGHTCCVPGCDNHTHRTPGVSFHRFPRDEALRKTWLQKIPRAGNSGKFSKFVPHSHRICGEHFVNGKRDLENPIPTIFASKPSGKGSASTRKAPANRVPLEAIGQNNMDVGVSAHSQSVTLSDHGPSNHPAIITDCRNCFLAEEEVVTNTQPDVDIPSEQDLMKTKDTLTQDHTYSVPVPHGLKKLLYEKDQQITVLSSRCEAMEKTIKFLQSELVKKNDTIRVKARQIAKQQQKLKTSQGAVKAQQKQKFCIESVAKVPGAIKYYTGFTSYEDFKNVFDFLSDDLKDITFWGSAKKTDAEVNPNRFQMSFENGLFMTLCRLRAGLDEVDLAFRFDVSQSTISRWCNTFIDLLFLRLTPFIAWPSRTMIDKYMPKCFKDQYPTTRVILDCTELFIETPSHFRVQSETYSSYKSHNTAKGLLGIAPNGFISFASDLSPGRVSDKDITVNSGLISLLQQNDSVMADRGFLIEDPLVCEKKNLRLNIPPFLRGQSQFDIRQEEETRKIASVRIHVERVIERVKNYQILNRTFPNSMAHQLNKTWKICCALVNITTDPIASD